MNIYIYIVSLQKKVKKTIGPIGSTGSASVAANALDLGCGRRRLRRRIGGSAATNPAALDSASTGLAGTPPAGGSSTPKKRSMAYGQARTELWLVFIRYFDLYVYCTHVCLYMTCVSELCLVSSVRFNYCCVFYDFLRT